MGEILKGWLRTRLGVMMDLRPEIFGHYTRDGRLLAQILHSYDIISRDQLETIIQTQDPALSRVNLKQLRVWLRFLGVSCEDECIEEISRGNGVTGLRLFYRVYLCLENKDRLHFITLKKERERYLPSSRKFDVSTVREDEPPVYQPSPTENSTAVSNELIANRDTIEWHREKFPPILRGCKREREMFESPSRRRFLYQGTPAIRKLGDRGSRKVEELDRFPQEHPRATVFSGTLRESGKLAESLGNEAKRLGRPGNEVLGTKIHGPFASKVWREFELQRDREFDWLLARCVLDQSRYEKRVVRRLCEVREEKSRIAENRKFVEELMLKAKEQDRSTERERGKDATARDSEELEAEYQRMAELRCRIAEEKVRRLGEKHRGECVDIVDSLIELAIKVANYRRMNDGYVPEQVWSYWAVLFRKKLPVLALEGAQKEGTEAEDDLRESLFDDYNQLNSPWNEFAARSPEDEAASKLGEAVLARIVGRLLEAGCPSSTDREVAPFAGSKTVAIVLGIPNLAQHRSAFQALLDDHGIRTVLMEDAINHCLARYKEEISEVGQIDSRAVARTESTIHSLQAEIGRQAGTERQTQTPGRMMSCQDTDPVLTDTGYIGKWAYEFLAVGEPITDELSTKILIEYLKTLPDANGWALIDYPVTYEQTALLQSWLTGTRRKTPADPALPSFKNVSVEEIDPASPRILFQAGENASRFPLNNRQSRLVPNPSPRKETRTNARFAESSFARIIVRVVPKPSAVEADRTAANQPIDQFYAHHREGYVFHYSTFDLDTLKELVSTIVSGSHRSESVAEGSDGVFAAVVNTEATISTKEEAITEKDRLAPKPGEDGWEWVEVPLADVLLRTLGSLWYRMETTYVRDIGVMLVTRAFQANSIGPYRDSLLRNGEKLIGMPDDRQEVVREFQRAFNGIEADARDDLDVKRELHRRVANFQSNLWEFCDDKRRRAEADRLRLIENDRTFFEAMILLNLYVGMLQAEIDRCIVTIRIIHDYYSAALGKPVQQFAVSNIILRGIELDQNYSANDKERREEESAGRPGDRKRTKDRGKPVASADSTNALGGAAAPPAVHQSELRDQIRNLFVDTSSKFEPTGTLVYKAIVDNVRYIRNLVASLGSAMLDDTVAGQTAPVSGETPGGKEDDVSPLSRKEDASLEWKCAASYEFARVRRRLAVLAEAAKSDIEFVVGTMRNAFHEIHGRIVERYNEEVKAANDGTRLFCFAIEKGSPVNEEISLVAGRCLVKPDVEEKGDDVLVEETFRPAGFRMDGLVQLFQIFRRIAPRARISVMSLLYVLQDLLGQSEEEAASYSILPHHWRRLRPTDLAILIETVFGTGQLYIDWREFILHAMELPMPSTGELLDARNQFRAHDTRLKETVRQDQYYQISLWFDRNFERRIQVPGSRTGQLCRGGERAGSPLEEGSQLTKEAETIRQLLCRMFLTDQDTLNYTGLLLSFCKDEDPREGLAKAFSLAIGNPVCTDAEQTERYLARRRLVKEEEEEQPEGSGRGEFRQQPRRREQVQTSVDREAVRVEGQIGEESPGESFSSFGDSGCTTVAVTWFPLEAGQNEDEQPALVHSIPRQLCLTVLAAALPSLASEPSLFDTPNSLQEEISRVYEELWKNDSTGRENDTVLAVRLFNHPFIANLLAETRKFSVSRMSDLIETILRKKRGPDR